MWEIAEGTILDFFTENYDHEGDDDDSDDEEEEAGEEETTLSIVQCMFL